MAARQVKEPRKAFWGHTTDLVEHLVDADYTVAAIFILEQQGPWSTVAGEMDPQWRRLATQPCDEILQLAHLVDHDPNMVMQGTRDVVTLRLIVESTILRG
jgi:hypothetical protein